MKQTNSIEQINTSRHVFIMSLPIFVELLLQLLVGNIDQIMVSRVSQPSVAAIVNANVVINIVIIFFNMMSAATMIILSQFLGAGDKLHASKAASVSMTMIVAVGIFITAITCLVTDPLFATIRVPEEIYSITKNYMLTVMLFMIVQGLYLNTSAILKAHTLMKETMLAAVIMNVCNIIGNAILINGMFGLPKLGALGAAISTDISKCIGLITLIIIYIWKVKLPIGFKFLKPYPWELVKSLCYIAIPSSVENLSYNVSQMFILAIVNMLGTWVVVTKGYCSILANVSYVYTMALSGASQIVIGYLVGAKMIKEIKKRVDATMAISICVSMSVALILYLFRNQVFRIFTDTPEIIALGGTILLVEVFLEFGRSINIVMTRSLYAVGDMIFPTVVGIVFQWVVALGGSYILGVKLGWGLVGVWIAMAIDENARGIIYYIYFKADRWVKNFKKVG